MFVLVTGLYLQRTCPAQSLHHF